MVIQIKAITALLLYLFEKYFFPAYLLVDAILFISIRDTEDAGFTISMIDGFLKPVIMSFLLFFGSSKPEGISLKSTLGLILSFGSIYFFKNVGTQENNSTLSILLFSNYIFYLVLLLLSLFSLGKSFSISPSFSKIKTGGLYNLVRHPVYSCYLHFFLVFIVTNYSVSNIILYFFFYIGLYLRAKEEEKVLSESAPEYLNFFNNKKMFFNIYLSFPVLILLITLAYLNKETRHKVKSINIASPILALNPIDADDWSSFFVINHIYPRFQAKPGLIRSNSILSKKEVRCAEDKKTITSSSCKRVRIDFVLKKDVKSCSGQSYTKHDFVKEITEIVSRKNWIFPNFRWCKSKNCFYFDNISNIQHRMDSIYLRFGWSMNAGGKYGISPFCFYPERDEFPIDTGVLHIEEKDLKISTSNENQDIYLYGNKTDPTNYKNLKFYNPIYYLLIINGRLTAQELFSANERFYSTIRNTLYKNKITDSEGLNDGLNLFVTPSKNSNTIKTFKPKIAIPDFWPSCKEIGIALTTASAEGADFFCTNISAFTEKLVKKEKGAWDGFISPVTPGFPGKDALTVQYLDYSSNDNWLGLDEPKQSEIKLLGISNGTLQALKNVVCSVQPNPLGLSDIVIDDFVACQ